MIKKLFYCTIILIISIFLSSCAGKSLIKPSEPRMAVEGEITVSMLKNAVLFNKISSIKSEVNIEIYKDNEVSSTYNGMFAYKSPSSFGLRIFGPFGLTAGDVTVNENLIQAYIPMKNVLYNSTVPNLSGFIKIILLEDDKNIVFTFEEHNDSYILYALAAGEDRLEIICRYTFSKDNLNNTGISLYKERQRFIELSFSDFSAEPETMNIPLSIKLTASDKQSLGIRLIEPIINGTISDTFFAPKDPEGKDVKPIKDISTILKKLK